MATSVDRGFTVPEAAFLAGLPDKAVQREIDAGIVAAELVEERREVGFGDVLYLATVRDLRASLTPGARARLRQATLDAVRDRSGPLRLGPFVLDLNEVEAGLAERLERLSGLERLIGSDPAVRAGEPVVLGTRIPARLVAGLVSQGAATEEIVRDYGLNPEQVEAAVLFDRAHPRRGRPAGSPMTPVDRVDVSTG